MIAHILSPGKELNQWSSTRVQDAHFLLATAIFSQSLGASFPSLPGPLAVGGPFGDG